MNNEHFVDFSWIVNVLLRRKWLMLIPLAIALFFSIVMLIFVPINYRATTTLMVEPAENYKTSEINVLMAGERLALTYSEIINSRPILLDVVNQMDFEIDISDLSDMVTVQPIENTQLIQVYVTSKSAVNSIKLANTLSNSFISYVKNLSRENYKEQLSENQLSIDAKQKEIDNLIGLINQKNEEKTNLLTEKSKLELDLSLHEENFQTLIQNSQSLSLALSENANKVLIVESAFFNMESSNASNNVASSIVFISKDILTDNQNDLINFSNIIGTIYAPMIRRDSVLTQVITKMSLPDTSSSLSSRISYDLIENTQFIRINVSDVNLNNAIAINNVLTKTFVDDLQNNLVYTYNKQLANLQRQQNDLATEMDSIQEKINQNSINSIPVDLEIERLSGELASKTLDLQNLQSNYDLLILESQKATNTIVISEPAAQAKKLIENKIIYVGVILILGLVVGIGLVFLFENFDDKLHTQEDILNLLDLKPIGTISQISHENNKLIFESKSSPHVSEDFRKLGATIRPALKELSIKTLLVTSPYAGEGKSTIVANLGLILAKTGTRVVIVDADLHIPRQHIIFDISQREGLSDYLSGKSTEPVLKETKTENLRILTSGDQHNEFVELLSSPYLEKLLNYLTNEAEVVIIDSPPILTLADASYITPYVDGALLVFRSGVTKRKIALDAATILKNAGIRYLRYILNDVVESTDHFYQYYDNKTTDNDTPNQS